MTVNTSIPVKSLYGAAHPNSWLVWVSNTSGYNASIRVYAACATASQVSSW